MKLRVLVRPLSLTLTLAACALAVGALCYDRALADEPAEATADPAADGAEGDEAEPKKDPFEIPDGDAKELQAFMRGLAQAEAEGESEQEQAEFAEKLLKTMNEAADRLLAAKPSEKQAAEAYQFKMRALELLTQLGDSSAEKKLVKAIDAARADERTAVVGAGWQYAIQRLQRQWEELSAGKRRAFKKEVLAAVNEGGPNPIDVSIVRTVADGFERVDEEFVAELLAEAVPLFKESKDAKVKRALADSNLEGLMRRLNLLGNTMEVTGTLLDGKPVDWKSYRGKVVLVDFWATWCGPCIGELPNVLEMYEAYHDKGFEVIGVSLDDTPEAAEEFIAERKIPWSSIFPKNEKDRSWNHPLAQYYGISGIPTAILVDKDGKVVSLNARDQELRVQLQQLLGDPVAATEATADEPAAE